jgi:hypothetical protein
VNIDLRPQVVKLYYLETIFLKQLKYSLLHISDEGDRKGVEREKSKQ